jgi:hypothetical protein
MAYYTGSFHTWSEMSPIRHAYYNSVEYTMEDVFNTLSITPTYTLRVFQPYSDAIKVVLHYYSKRICTLSQTATLPGHNTNTVLYQNNLTFLI